MGIQLDMSKKPTYLDGILGSQTRDIQGEILDIAGADICELEAGRGRWNDNHGTGHFNSLGVITEAKKIFKVEDCENDRHRYYWDKIKAPYIYGRGFLYDDDDHPNAKATAAILRSIHKHDSPLKLKLSVEGAVIARGIKDPSLLAHTKIHSCAITFTPANTATLAEPLNIEKTSTNWASDLALIKSVVHLAKSDVPSFRHITRQAQANKIEDTLLKVNTLAAQAGLSGRVPVYSSKELMAQALESRIQDNVNKINELVKGAVTKSLTAGYGGAGAPTDATGGSVLQTESLDVGREFKHILCDHCGDEQIHMKHQVKCRKCGKAFNFAKLLKFFAENK